MPLSEHSRDGLRHVIAANRGGDPATDQCEIAVQGKPKVAWKSGMHHELTETVCGSILKLVPMYLPRARMRHSCWSRVAKSAHGALPCHSSRALRSRG